MTLRIRTATLDDLGIVTELEQAAFLPAEAASRERMEQRLLYFPNHFHLMFNGDVLVSYISAMPSDERDLRDEMYADARLQDELGSWEIDLQRRHAAVLPAPRHRLPAHAQLP